MSSKGWKKYKLIELGKLARGKSRHRPRDAAFLYGGPYPFIQTGDIKSANHKTFKYSQTYSEEGLAQSKLWPEGTIAITIAANIADTAILTFPACFPDSVLGFVADKEICDVDFIEYLLQHYKKQIQSHAVGSVQDNINLGTFESVEFEIPPLPTQLRIAEILSVLDDKIELNRQTNATLEAIAQAIFKEWFVNFNFPGATGEMQESELGLIPVGWRVGRIKDFTKRIQYGFTQSASNEKVGPRFLRITDIQNGYIDWANVPYCVIDKKDWEKYKIENYDIFIARTGASTGENTLVIDPPEAVFASYLIRIQFRETELALYVGKLLRSRGYFDFIDSIKSGSAQPNANAQQLTDFVLVLPPANLLKNYSEIVEQIEQLKAEYQNQSATLAQIRDNLLPKLMSGEIVA